MSVTMASPAERDAGKARGGRSPALSRSSWFGAQGLFEVRRNRAARGSAGVQSRISFDADGEASRVRLPVTTGHFEAWHAVHPRGRCPGDHSVR